MYDPRVTAEASPSVISPWAKNNEETTHGDDTRTQRK